MMVDGWLLRYTKWLNTNHGTNPTREPPMNQEEGVPLEMFP
jgi:hypothetical protein